MVATVEDIGTFAIEYTKPTGTVGIIDNASELQRLTTDFGGQFAPDSATLDGEDLYIVVDGITYKYNGEQGIDPVPADYPNT